MRRQVARFSAGRMSVQCCTSSKLRPQPLQIASPWLVEQIAMHGVSGVDVVPGHPGGEGRRRKRELVGQRLVVVHHQRIDLGQRRTSGASVMPSGDGFLLAPVVDGRLDVGDVNACHGNGLQACDLATPRRPAPAPGNGMLAAHETDRQMVAERRAPCWLLTYLYSGVAGHEFRQRPDRRVRDRPVQHHPAADPGGADACRSRWSRSGCSCSSSTR